MPLPAARGIDPARVQGLGDLPQGRRPTTLNLPDDRDHIGRALVCAVNDFSYRLLARLADPWVAERNATRLSGCQGPLRQAAFFGPTVANGALRTWMDLQLAPPSRDCRPIAANRQRNFSVAHDAPHDVVAYSRRPMGGLGETTSHYKP